MEQEEATLAYVCVYKDICVNKCIVRFVSLYLCAHVFMCIGVHVCMWVYVCVCWMIWWSSSKVNYQSIYQYSDTHNISFTW